MKLQKLIYELMKIDLDYRTLGLPETIKDIIFKSLEIKKSSVLNLLYEEALDSDNLTEMSKTARLLANNKPEA